MGIARYKDLCIDSGPGETMGRFWAAALGLEFEPGDSPDEAGALKGLLPAQRVWMNVVPELRTVKHRVHLDVHCAEPREIATRWADVFGARLGGDDGKGWWWLENVPGLPFDGWSFVPVPEPKTLKNRVHWDVLVESVDDLVAAGATVLHGPAPDGDWSILADPEGNEFCAFVAAG